MKIEAGGEGKKGEEPPNPLHRELRQDSTISSFLQQKMLDQMFTAYMDVRAGRISDRERERVLHLEPKMRKKKRERNLLEGRGTLFHRTAESSWPRT